MPSSAKHKIMNFLRYPGSKRRMLEFLGEYLPSSDAIGGRYVEPCVGGGAVFFFVNPHRALLSDINSDLINLYRGIRQSPALVWERYYNFGNTRANSYSLYGLGVNALAGLWRKTNEPPKGSTPANRKSEWNPL
jgi:DNA adenine methylase